MSENEADSSGNKIGYRFILLVTLALALVVAGIFLPEPFIFLSVPIVSLAGFILLQFRRPDLQKLEVRRTLERLQIREDESCRVRLRIRNGGVNAISFLQVRDSVPDELAGDGTQSNFTTSLARGETRDLFYEVQPEAYGEYNLGPVELAAQDGSGLIESSLTVNVRSKLIILPRSAGKLTGFTIGPKTTKPRPGEIPARRAGLGMDFNSVRQLLPGESARRINWRASARVSDESVILANEFTDQRVAETLIIVDGRSGFELEEKRDSINSYSVRAAMSIAERLLRDKNRVGLLTMGSFTERVAPAYGRRQFDRISLTLARFVAGRRPQVYGTGSVPYTIRYYFPRVSQLVLISPLMDEDTLATAADLARGASTYDLMIVSPNPLDFPLSSGEEKTVTNKAYQRAKWTRYTRRTEWRIAWKLSTLERRTNIARLEGAGAIVLDWRVSDPLEQVIAAHRHAVAKRIAQLARR